MNVNVALQFFLMSFRFKKERIDNHIEDIIERKQDRGTRPSNLCGPVRSLAHLQGGKGKGNSSEALAAEVQRPAGRPSS